MEALQFLSSYLPDEYDQVDEWGVGFWARREIDGSKEELYKALLAILSEYDEQYLIDNQ